MALNLKKKPQPLVKISLQMEQPAYETFSAFLHFLQEREQNPDITANEVINEILREYLSGTAADVRGWREQQALGPAPKQPNSGVPKQNTPSVAKHKDAVVSTVPQAAQPAASVSTTLAQAPTPAASSASTEASIKEAAPVTARRDEVSAQRFEVSPERQRQILDEEVRKKTASLPQDPPKAT